MAEIYAVNNRKGGVGKTATALNLAAAWAEDGARVLAVDMDGSGDLTQHAGIELQDGDSTVFEVLTAGAPLQDAVRRVEREGGGYDVLPADSALDTLQDALGGGAPTQLRDALAGIADSYDRIVIDTPPTMGAAAVQALAAADAVIIPARAEYLSLAAVQAMRDTVTEMQPLNPGLHIGGVVLTGYNPRSTYARDMRGVLDEAMPGALYDAYISTGVGVSEAAAAGMDLLEYVKKTPRRRKTRAVAQYRELAKEITEREEHHAAQ